MIRIILIINDKDSNNIINNNNNDSNSSNHHINISNCLKAFCWARLSKHFADHPGGSFLLR